MSVAIDELRPRRPEPGRAGLNRSGSTREFELTERDFKAIVTRVRDATGIVLGDNKRELVYGRLGRRLRTLGFRTFAEYLEFLDSPAAGDEQGLLVNAITTNLTGFFREKHHFDALSQQALPDLVAAGGTRRLRVWSAGCSSGEEPYSIAMTLHATVPDLKVWDARILATDIDTDMIATCKAGRYAAEKAEPIPASLRQRYTRKVDAGTVEMTQAVRDLISFKPLNLLQAWPMQSKFDMIFCRNVVIYFDKPTQCQLFDRFAEMLAPGGWLFIGHSESLFRVSDRFQHLGRTIYRKLR